MDMIIATHNKHKVEEFSRILAPLGVTIRTAALTEAEETGATFRVPQGEVRLRRDGPALHRGRFRPFGRRAGRRAGRLLRALCAGGAAQADRAAKARERAGRQARGALHERDLLRVPERRRAGEGRCYGSIAHECRGAGGFGYDPIFLCAEEGCAGKTFGEASPEEKDAVSHRGRSLRLFVEKLENYLKDKGEKELC